MSAQMTPEQFQAFLNGPVSQPPPGVVANLVNPDSLALANYIMVSISIAVPTLAVFLRLYYRHFHSRAIGADDWTILVAWASFIAYCSIGIVGYSQGYGKHQWDTKVIELQDMLYNERIMAIMYSLATLFVKTSILLQYLRIFCPKGSRGFMFWSCWTWIVIVILFYTSNALVGIFMCIPFRKYWTPWLEGGTCINFIAINVVSGVFNSMTDAVLIILPQRSIWKLNMSTARKWKASLVFLVASFAMASSVVRLYYSTNLLTSEDKTWATALMGLWIYAEFVTTFACSCMPALAGLFKRWESPVMNAARKLSSFGRSRNTSSDSIAQMKDNVHYYGERVHGGAEKTGVQWTSVTTSPDSGSDEGQ